MCGITGFIDCAASHDKGSMERVVGAMSSTLVHRGPDDSGSWIEERCGVAFGFRRLAILDLTSEGHQPMISASGRYVIVFNGEVYNFRAIRQELEQNDPSLSFRGGSDTEVMLAAIEALGLEAAVKRFIGMFAFALFDRREQMLFLVRDRFGVKPLYYGRYGGVFLFGSEIKAIKAHPAFDATIDRDALALFFRHKYVPCPHSIYKGLRKLTPGTIMRIDARSLEQSDPRPYWSAQDAALGALDRPFRGSAEEAADELDSLLSDAVSLRMIADVPLGVFLSGGTDSSTVTAKMQAMSSRPVKTFTVGFREIGFDEAKYARKVADYLGTDHTEIYVSAEEALATIPDIPHFFDEPFSDSSQIPTYLVSRLARRQVTVALSGDGGDELFCGYERYSLTNTIWNRIRWVDSRVRRLMSRALAAFPVGKLRILSRIVNTMAPQDLYRWLYLSHWDAPESLVCGSREPDTFLTEPHRVMSGEALYQWMMLADTLMYLPDDLLVKVDRSSMAVSLEAREPLLDHRLFEFAWSLPTDMKVRSGKGKLILKNVLYRYVPQEVLDRPKMGFAVPLDSWLRGPLRDWAESLLNPDRLRQEGYLSADLVTTIWNQHLWGRRLSGRRFQHGGSLWDVLMFQAWLENQ